MRKAVFPVQVRLFTRWDGTDAEEVSQLAGSSFLGVHQGLVIIARDGEEPFFIEPGWYISKPADGEGFAVHSETAWRMTGAQVITGS